VGGGSLIAVIATHMPEGIWKSVMIWASPAVTITLSALWIWGRQLLVTFWNDQEAERHYKATRTAIHDAIKGDYLTEEQRKDFEAKLVELEKMRIDQKLARAAHHAKRG